MTTTSRARYAANVRHYGPELFDPHYRLPVHPAHDFSAGMMVFIQEAKGIYRRGIIKHTAGWLGNTPAYTVRMFANNVTHMRLSEKFIFTFGQVYGIVA